MTIIKNKNNNIAFIGDYKQAKHFERAARGHRRRQDTRQGCTEVRERPTHPGGSTAPRTDHHHPLNAGR